MHQYGKAACICGLALLKLEHIRKAKNCFEISRRELESHLSAYYYDSYTWKYKGLACFYLGKYREAMEAFEKAYKCTLENESPPIIKGIGYLNSKDYIFIIEGIGYLNSNDYKKAQDAFKRATKINPSSDDAWTGAGFAYIMSNKYGDALAAFKKALKCNS